MKTLTTVATLLTIALGAAPSFANTQAATAAKAPAAPAQKVQLDQNIVKKASKQLEKQSAKHTKKVSAEQKTKS